VIGDYLGHGPWPRAMTKRSPKSFILTTLGHICKIALEFEGSEFGRTHNLKT
jgi:hypothetical protein